MKKSLIITGAIVLVLLLLAFVLPVIFKGKIKQIVDAQIEQSIKAEITYSDFSLSLFRGFPNLTLAVDQISVVGMEEFEGDTLLSAQEFSVTVNPYKALFSDNLEIKSIDAQHPRVIVRILEDGTANYDIAIDSAEEESPEDAPSSYQFGIQQWNLSDGSLIYDDAQSGFFMELHEMNHQGSGDFTQDLFDLNTTTHAFLRSLSYQDLEYMSDKQLNADMTLEMNLPLSKYTFQENLVSINEFGFGLDGWLSMPENSEDILMDLTFETRQNEFQHLLSLVPGMYTEGFENITSSGLVTMQGKVSGTYNEQQIPEFQLSLDVEDGMFQYPDLPTAVRNINLNMLLANEDGNPDHTLVDISRIHLEFGQNPIDGRVRVFGFSTPEIDAELTAALNLAELTSMFPMDGTTLKGDYQLSVKAEGTYDSLSQTFPIVDARMQLNDGFIKSEEFPESLQQFNLVSNITNSTGKLPDTRVEVPDFSFVIDQEPVSGRLTLTNPNDYHWDVAINGGVDLEKMTHIFPLEGMALAGVIRGELSSTGKLSSLEAEKYAEIPTSGNLEVVDFSYSSEDLSYPFQISRGNASFTPQQITLTEITAQTGSTDLRINGGLSNYINYLFSDNQPISGKINLESNNVDLNEWMSDSEPAEESEESLSVIEIPSNVDLTIQAQAGKVLYDNMTLGNVKGQIVVAEGVANMQNLSFNSLGGGFLLSGIYDPTNIKNPEFDMSLEMQQVSIREAFQTFNTVKVLAPVAQFVNGDFSSSFKINGNLQPDMMPKLSTLTGIGLVNIATAALSVTDSELVQGISQLTQFSGKPQEFKLNDVIMAIKIKDGQMDVAPFVASFGDYKTEVSGSTGIDGTMNFKLNMEVPAGVIGTSVNQAIARLTGNDQPVDDKLNLNLNLGGTYNDPKFTLGGLDDRSTTAGIARSAVEQKTQEAKDSAEALVDQQAQKITESAKKQLDSLISSGVEDSTTEESLKEAAKELLNEEKVEGVLNLFKKKETGESESNDN